MTQEDSTSPTRAGCFRRACSALGPEALGIDFRLEYAAFSFLAMAAFLAPVSLPAGHAAAAISGLLLVAHAFHSVRRIALPATAILAAIFAMVAVAVTYLGMNPDIGVPKLRQLILWFLLPVTATLGNTRQRTDTLVKCMAGGMLVLAAWQLVQIPWDAWQALRAGTEQDVGDALIHAGSMTHAQRLMVGVILAAAWWLQRRERQQAGRAPLVILAFCLAALVLNFKRGSWVCAIICAGLFLWPRVGRRGRLLAVLCGVVVLCLPPVQSRLLAIRQEFEAGSGGRWLMWRQIAPALVRDYPEGIGWHSLTNAWMRELAPDVEPNQTHLHSNILQVLVETGWLGFAVYAMWMMKAFADTLGYSLFARDRGEALLARGVCYALLALLLNGLVEYNFGDSEIILLYGFLMGWAAAGMRRVMAPASGTRNGQSVVPPK